MDQTRPAQNPCRLHPLDPGSPFAGCPQKGFDEIGFCIHGDEDLSQPAALQTAKDGTDSNDARGGKKLFQRHDNPSRAKARWTS
jgi:hypothetical protein